MRLEIIGALFLYPKGADIIRKITFTNEVNGLSCEFSTATPMMFLESVDGCSCGSTAITYKPIEYNGQRLISTSLDARTIPITVQISGKNESGMKYSRAEALKVWNDIQKVFIPGQIGTLVWSDGEHSRFIRCRCSESPNPHEILPFLFRINIAMTADSPLWYDTVENVVSFAEGTTTTFNNDCGIAVPFKLEASAASGAFVLVSASAPARMGFVNSVSEAFVIDTDACTVTTASGELVNHLLLVESDFFKIVPGENTLNYAGADDVVIKWRKAYMGVY